MKKLFSLLALLALAAAGCHSNAQIPPASAGYKVNLTWNAPTAGSGWGGCTTSAPCSYAVFAETLAAGATVCDPASNANWKEISTPTARPTTAAFTDGAATGLNRCYGVQTVQAAQNSTPSNTFEIQVPGIPLAPQLLAPATAAATLEPLTVLPQVKPALAFASSPASPFGLRAVASR